ncbi:ABC transporter permease [Gudongella sp. DL1XJH-153]|uniref:ABC transporter permease n=1 Tax=Gudongella sp. DL1XJH-153 TaxID=3409804 RepID=UPI003BB6C299
MDEGMDFFEEMEPVDDSSGFLVRLFSNRMARFGGVVILVVLLFAIFAPIIAPYEYDAMNLPEMLKAPSADNIFGTDEFGRDIFSRIIYGSRISLKVGFLAVGISMLIGTTLGALAGFYGGVIDLIISGITDIAWSFPVTLLAIAFVAALGPSLTNLIIALAIVSWSGFARLVRGQFLSLREKEFVEAARSLGMSDSRIILKHILPNAFAPIIVLTSLEVPKAIIIEASLSFLGLGAQPPAPSWGSIMSSGRDYIMEAPWVSFFPGIMIALIVLGFNLFGDALRDTLDPRLKD